MAKITLNYEMTKVNQEVECLQVDLDGEKKILLALTEACFNYKPPVEDELDRKPGSWSFFVSQAHWDKESKTWKKSGIQFVLPDGRKANLELTLFIQEGNGKKKVLPKQSFQGRGE